MQRDIDFFVDRTEDPEDLYYLVKRALTKWNEKLHSVEFAFEECRRLYDVKESPACEEREDSTFVYEAPKMQVGGVIETGIAIPEGFSGYHKQQKRFVKWFDGAKGPVSKQIVNGKEAKLSKCGFWAMEVSESNEFNKTHEENKALVLKDIKPRLNIKTAEVEAAQKPSGEGAGGTTATVAAEDKDAMHE